MLVDTPLDWATPAVRAASMGPKQAKKGRFPPSNFLFANELPQIITILGRGRIFSQLAIISYLCSLRIPPPVVSGVGPRIGNS